MALILFMAISSFFAARSHSGRKTIGSVEDVDLMPWNIRLTARIDTGAATSSLSVKNILVTNSVVEFNLPDRKSEKHVKVPLLEWRTVKSSDGTEERRPVVEIEIKLAGRKMLTQITLDDRSKMSYPILIGRRTLRGRFVVDVAKNKTGTVEQWDRGGQ